MRPPDLPGGNAYPLCARCGNPAEASMRPPDLPGGNLLDQRVRWRRPCRASMRPPDLPGGNPEVIVCAKCTVSALQ